MKKLPHIHKVQELVYELKIRDAAHETVTISPETMMSQVRQILRSKKITAAPVVGDNKLLGIVSVEDYINWVQDGGEDVPVSQRMSRDLVTLFEDEAMVDAIKDFDRYKYYEFPVLSRSSGELIGIVTRFDVIASLLKALDIDYYRKEISQYQRTNFFQETVSESTFLTFNYTVAGGEIGRGGEVASKLKKNLSYLGIHPEVIRRVAIVTYEAEMNLIIYGGGGQVKADLDCQKITVTVSDDGPGIDDVEKVMQPGFSTAPDWIRELGFGAGMGLPNIKNNSEQLSIDSKPGKGTRLKAIILWRCGRDGEPGDESETVAVPGKDGEVADETKESVGGLISDLGAGGDA
ncbi:MAG: CBS domain-containing protein [Spirochaetales bacterium]|nr:CBS domain-containing protein [Spirochaetales bacterium]